MYVWRFEDQAMSGHAARAIMRGEDWTSGDSTERQADLLALMARSIISAHAIGDGALELDGDGALNVIMEGDAAHANPFIHAITSAWGALAGGGKPSYPTITSTISRTNDAGLAWAGAIVAIVGIAAVCYIAEKVSEVTDNQLARKEDTRRLVALTGQIAQRAEAHRLAELAMGKPLPVSEADKIEIEALTSLATTVAERKTPPISQPIGAGIGSAVGTGGSLLAIGALAVGGYYLWKEMRNGDQQR